ncbi:MAG: NAD(P)-dependent oxidoreductase [Desulfobacterales bacterium]|jgi:3-hydroxyisobutyrate dehydrogenase-like beta-hydroxyacid dehydrogenase
MENIGVVGTGVMGFTVCEKILKAGHPLVVYDVNTKAAERAVNLGAIVGGSLAEVANKSMITLLFLPGPKEVIECIASEDGLLSAAQAGSVIVDMGTTDPETSERMAEKALQRRIGYLDAPILGRPITVGNWTLPVGGEKEHVDRCRPIFELFAANIYHVGPVGTGNKIKLLNQLMFGAINAMTAEMMAIAEKIGISPKLLYNTITASQAGTVSNLFKELGGRIAEENYDDPTFTINLLVKDIKLAVQMAKNGQAPPILAQTIELINEISQAQGLGNKDTSIMWKSFEKVWQTHDHMSGSSR